MFLECLCHMSTVTNKLFLENLMCSAFMVNIYTRVPLVTIKSPFVLLFMVFVTANMELHIYRVTMGLQPYFFISNLEH